MFENLRANQQYTKTSSKHLQSTRVRISNLENVFGSGNIPYILGIFKLVSETCLTPLVPGWLFLLLRYNLCLGADIFDKRSTHSCAEGLAKLHQAFNNLESLPLKQPSLRPIGSMGDLPTLYRWKVATWKRGNGLVDIPIPWILWVWTCLVKGERFAKLICRSLKKFKINKNNENSKNIIRYQSLTSFSAFFSDSVCPLSYCQRWLWLTQKSPVQVHVNAAQASNKHPACQMP